MRDIVVQDWPDLDAETIKLLEENYIHSLKSFIRATAKKESRQQLRDAGLSAKRIREMRREAKRLIAALPEMKIIGVLEGYFETGTEGVMWAVYEDGKTGYEGLHILEKGDWLLVYDEDGVVRFEGVIKPDYEKGWQEYPMNPGHGQPCALGMWIHWTQEGWEPDDWATLFMNPPCRAELTVNKKWN